MRRENIIVGLDIGTTKVCVVVGEVFEGGLEIRGVGTSPSTGLRKGAIVNIELTVESIKKAVEAAESFTGIEIREAYVCTKGSHIKGFNSYGAVGLRGKEVTPLDVENVIESASAHYISLDREVLHVIPTGYILDGQDGIKDPVGMAGVRLEGHVHILTGAVSSIQNLLKCCEKADLGVVEVVFEPLASAEAVLMDEEREIGVAVVDIGGGTTDIVLFKDGWMQHSSVLTVGGNHFTNDIAVGLRIPLSEAEKVKKSFGCTVVNTHKEDDEITFIQGGQERKIPRKYLTEIIQPRAEELLDLLKNELSSCSGYSIASSGLVLTGGGSLLDGIDKLAEAVLGLPVRIGFPETMKDAMGIINSPIYSTGAGIVLYGFNKELEGSSYQNTLAGILGKVKEWLTGMLR